MYPHYLLSPYKISEIGTHNSCNIQNLAGSNNTPVLPLVVIKLWEEYTIIGC